MTVVPSNEFAKTADMIVGDKDGKYVHSIGVFVSGGEEKLKRLQDLVKEHGSIQTARSAFQAEYPDEFVTVAAVRRNAPLTGKPAIHLQAGRPGTSDQSGFYNDVMGSGGVPRAASLGSGKSSSFKPAVIGGLKGGALGGLAGAYSGIKSGAIGKRGAIGALAGAALGAGISALSHPKIASSRSNDMTPNLRSFVDELMVVGVMKTAGRVDDMERDYALRMGGFEHEYDQNVGRINDQIRQAAIDRHGKPTAELSDEQRQQILNEVGLPAVNEMAAQHFGDLTAEWKKRSLEPTPGYGKRTGIGAVGGGLAGFAGGVMAGAHPKSLGAMAMAAASALIGGGIGALSARSNRKDLEDLKQHPLVVNNGLRIV